MSFQALSLKAPKNCAIKRPRSGCDGGVWRVVLCGITASRESQHGRLQCASVHVLWQILPRMVLGTKWVRAERVAPFDFRIYPIGESEGIIGILNARGRCVRSAGICLISNGGRVPPCRAETGRTAASRSGGWGSGFQRRLDKSWHRGQSCARKVLYENCRPPPRTASAALCDRRMARRRRAVQ